MVLVVVIARHPRLARLSLSKSAGCFTYPEGIESFSPGLPELCEGYPGYTSRTATPTLKGLESSAARCNPVQGGTGG
jgi:hypothetical protein